MITDSGVIRTLLGTENKDYELFCSYCVLLNKGLRKNALIELEKFLKATKNWEQYTKITFCKYFFSSSEKSSDLDAILTSNFIGQLIEPTLIEMIKQEPFNYLPLKWYGVYFKNKKSLYATDQLLNSTLLSLIDESLWYSTHHLPQAYLGSIEEDEIDIAMAFLLIDNFELPNPESHKKAIVDYKSQIENYIENT